MANRNPNGAVKVKRGAIEPTRLRAILKAKADRKKWFAANPTGTLTQYFAILKEGK